jgi:long-subunit acyl-CoA synthetase (AMP-forming)
MPLPRARGVRIVGTTKEQLDRRVDGQTICSRFLDRVDADPDRVALRAFLDDEPGGPVQAWTWSEYADRVARAAAGLQMLGVGPGDRVVLMVRNVPSFHFVDLAVNFLGATSVSLYNTSSPEQIAYLAGHCHAKVAVVEDAELLERFLAARHELDDLRHLVLLDNPLGLRSPGVLDGVELLEGYTALDLHDAADDVHPDDLATVIYTSGTTGPPKGVMLSHYNVVWTAEAYTEVLDVETAGLRAVSYLPMAHVAERMAGHYLALCAGFEVTTCPDATQLAAYIRAVRPQTMFGVPRVWEKIHAGIQAAMAADPEVAKAFDAAVAKAEPIAERRTDGSDTTEDQVAWEELDEEVFRKVRKRAGLGALKFAVTGAAPIPPELIRWYRAIGVPLSEIYGLSETTGPLTWEPYKVRPGRVGVAFPGCDVFLDDAGEVCCRGGNVFLGYLDDPGRTAEALDEDGTLRTGDVGDLDEDGYLRIVDRMKELIITSGGKNVSPANLEAAIKTLPLVGQVCAVGDGHPFVVALVVLDPEVAPVWARKQGIRDTSLAALAGDPEVRAEVEAGVAEVMERFNQAEQVKRVAILGEEWLPDSDELTPTSKLKRRTILSKYADAIDDLYAATPA